MKAWKQLIALNLVLVLLLSLFPFAAFAVQDQAQYVLNQTENEEPEETTFESPTIQDPESVVLEWGEPYTFTKTDDNSFPHMSFRTKDMGYYRLRITPPENLKDVKIGGNYWYNPDTDMSLEIHYTMVSPFNVLENTHDYIYFFYQNNTPGFRLCKNSDSEFSDNGVWTFQADYIEPEPFSFGEVLGAGDSEPFHVYTMQVDHPVYCTVSSDDPIHYACTDGQPSMYGMTYDQQNDFSGTSEYFRVGTGTLMLAVCQTSGSSGVVLQKGNPQGSFGAEGDNLHWFFDTEQEKLTISGAGSMGDLDGMIPWMRCQSYAEEVEVQPGVTDIAPNSFSNVWRLRKVSLPEGLTSIGNQAFCYCGRLTDISIPSTVREIGMEAFSNTSIARFEIPAAVTSIGSNALRSSYLTSVEVDAANPAYSSADGVLYSRDGSTLLRFPAKKLGPFVVPNTVTTIASDAFSHCDLLKSLFLPDSIHSVGGSDTVPDRVCYGGTAEQWAAVDAADFHVPEGHLYFECSASDYLGETWQYELEDMNAHPRLSFTPEESGVYTVSTVSPSGLDCFMSYSSPESMTVYVAKDDEEQIIVGDWLGQPTFFFQGGDHYEMQTQPGFVVFPDDYRQLTELGTFHTAVQKLATQPLALGANELSHPEYRLDYYQFTAPADGYYQVSFEVPEGSSVFARASSEGSMNQIDSYHFEFLLKAGQSIVLPIRDEIESFTVNVEFDSSGLSGECGENASWNIDADGTLIIQGTGDMDDYSDNWLQSAGLKRSAVSLRRANSGSAPWSAYRNFVKAIRVEEGITSVGDYAFSGMGNVQQAELPASIREIGRNAFGHDSALEEISLSEGLLDIGDSAFVGCGSLTSVQVPDSVQSIGSWAFCDTALEQFRLPADLEQLGDGVFARVPQCEVEVPAAHDHFVKVDGIVYDRDQTTVYLCDHDTAGAVSLPESVTEIRAYAFANSDIESLTIPEGVEQIPDSMCQSCSSLTEIHFPSTIADRFGTDVVSDCSSLRDVYYEGSAVGWYQLTDDLRESTNGPLDYHFAEQSVAEEAGDGSHSVTLTEEASSTAYCFTAPEQGIYLVSAVGAELSMVLDSGKAPASAATYPSSGEAEYVKLDAGEKLFVVLKLPYSDTVDVQWSVVRAETAEADLGDHTMDTDNHDQLYCFVPEMDGLYRFDTHCYDYSFSAGIFDQNLKPINRYRYINDGTQFMALNAGEPVYLCFSAEYNPSLSGVYWSLAEQITISGQPENQSVEAGADAVLSVQANGEELSYQWQYCAPGEDAWTDVEADSPQSDTLTICASDDLDGQRFRCRITNIDGYEVVSKEATLTVSTPVYANPFTDVPSGRFYTDAVLWAYYHDPQVTDGVTPTTFMPERNCTRAHVVTLLWRASGCPEPESLVSKFSDVKDTSRYFYKAVLWAAEQEITTGYEDGTFRPDAVCTRAHVVAFLWRASGCPEPESLVSTLSDVKDTSSYFYKAVLWAAEQEITTGYDDGTFRPGAVCTRGHVVTFLYRADN